MSALERGPLALECPGVEKEIGVGSGTYGHTVAQTIVENCGGTP
jgi:hypothetical protein